MDTLDGALEVRRNHDFVQYDGRLLYGADNVAADNFCAGLDHGLEIPFLFAVDGGDFDAARNARADLLDDTL